MEYFEGEVSEVELQAKKMFQIWLENEADATPENLLYSLEGLGLLNTAQGIFWTCIPPLWTLFRSKIKK